MEFFNSAVDTLQTIVVGLGGALCVWGGVKEEQKKKPPAREKSKEMEV